MKRIIEINADTTLESVQEDIVEFLQMNGYFTDEEKHGYLEIEVKSTSLSS